MQNLKDLKDFIERFFKGAELDTTYIKLCNDFSDFDNRENLKIPEVKLLLKSLDNDYKYITRDRVFIKEFKFSEFSLRFFISFKGGISDFSYLIWMEGDNSNFYKERLASLSSSLDPHFENKVKFQCPIATSIEDYKKILTRIFLLVNELENKLFELDK